MKQVIHQKCATQIGWQDGTGKKGFIHLTGERRLTGEPYVCKCCGIVPPSETIIK